AAVDCRLPEGTAILLCIEHLHALVKVRAGYISIHVELWGARFTFLGGNDDHAVGCTRSINARRGSIFEDLNALDVVGVQFMHTALRWHAIDDIQRILIAVDRADATHAYRSGTARTAIRCDRHPSHTPL